MIVGMIDESQATPRDMTNGASRTYRGSSRQIASWVHAGGIELIGRRNLPLAVRFAWVSALSMLFTIIGSVPPGWSGTSRGSRAPRAVRWIVGVLWGLPGQALINALEDVRYRLSRAGRYEEALLAADRNVTVTLAVAKLLPQAEAAAWYADALDSVALTLMKQGDLQQAQVTAERAAQACAVFAADEPDAFLEIQARCLRRLSSIHRKLEREDGEAVTVAERRLAVERRLLERDVQHLRAHHRGVRRLADLYTRQGRTEDVIRVRSAAVASYREAAEASTNEAASDLLGGELDRLGEAYAAARRWEECLTVTQQSVEVYEHLAAHDPQRHLPDVGLALKNLARAHVLNQQPAKAQAAAVRALEIFRNAAGSDDSDGRRNLLRLADAQNILAAAHTAARDYTDADRSAAAKVETVRALLAKSALDDDLALLIEALIGWAPVLESAGSAPMALQTAAEAVELARAWVLRDDQPTAAALLARSLVTVSFLRSHAGDRAGSVSAGQEAIELLRPLAAENPGRFGELLAYALRTHAGHAAAGDRSGSGLLLLGEADALAGSADHEAAAADPARLLLAAGRLRSGGRVSSARRLERAAAAGLAAMTNQARIEKLQTSPTIAVSLAEFLAEQATDASAKKKAAEFLAAILIRTERAHGFSRPDEKFSAAARLAALWLKAGDAEKAINIYRKLISTYRHDPQPFAPILFAGVLQTSAVAMSSQGQHDEAIGCAREGLEIIRELDQSQPGHYQIELALALECTSAAYHDSGRHREALLHSVEVLSLDVGSSSLARALRNLIRAPEDDRPGESQAVIRHVLMSMPMRIAAELALLDELADRRQALQDIRFLALDGAVYLALECDDPSAAVELLDGIAAWEVTAIGRLNDSKAWRSVRERRPDLADRMRRALGPDASDVNLPVGTAPRRESLSAIYDELRSVEEWQQLAQPRNLASIAAQLGERRAVYILPGHRGGCAISVDGNGACHVWRTGLTLQSLQSVIETRDPRGSQLARETRLLTLRQIVRAEILPVLTEAAANGSIVTIIPVAWASNLPIYAECARAGIKAEIRATIGFPSETSRDGAPVIFFARGSENRPPLYWAAEEVHLLANNLGVTPISDRRCRAPELLGRMQASVFVHIAGHCIFRLDNPLESYLDVGGERLSLVQLWSHFRDHPAPRFVGLNICDGGASELLNLEQMLSFPSILVSAGARTVLAGLYPLSDRTASEISLAFYHHWFSGSSTGAALDGSIAEWHRTRPLDTTVDAFAIHGDRDLTWSPRGRLPELGKSSQHPGPLSGSTERGQDQTDVPHEGNFSSLSDILAYITLATQELGESDRHRLAQPFIAWTGDPSAPERYDALNEHLVMLGAAPLGARPSGQTEADSHFTADQRVQIERIRSLLSPNLSLITRTTTCARRALATYRPAAGGGNTQTRRQKRWPQCFPLGARLRAAPAQTPATRHRTSEHTTGLAAPINL
jgi:tetratricopeptide (TPR) repeat protein